MRTRNLLVAVCLGVVALMLVSSPAFSAARSETKPYVVGAVVTTGPLPGGIINDCSGSGPSSGGTCFAVDAADATVSVTVADDGGAQVSGLIQFADDAVVANQIGSITTFCGSVLSVLVPAGAKVMYVVTELVTNLTGACGGTATTLSGSITADFV